MHHIRHGYLHMHKSRRDCARIIACYEDDDEEYQTICKIGTGFKDEDLNTLSASLKEHEIDVPRQYYVISDAPVLSHLLVDNGGVIGIIGNIEFEARCLV